MRDFHVKSFFSGVLACLLLGGLGVGAAAATTNIPVSYGIKVLFDGQDFQPKDGAGQDVQLFSYNGTVYAPIRAVCEKAGLRVDYDRTTNTASVMSPGYVPPAQPQPAQTTPQTAPSSSGTMVNGVRFEGNGSAQAANWLEKDTTGVIIAVLQQECGKDCTVTATYYGPGTQPADQYGEPVCFLSSKPLPGSEYGSLFTIVISEKGVHDMLGGST